jgi:uncharacterized phiE125 gp8 family phage protein
MTSLQIVTPPTSEPVNLNEAKEHLRVEHTEDDTLIEGLITSAREWCEGFLNRAIITQTRKLTISKWPVKPLRLPGSPIQEISSVDYVDSAGETQGVEAVRYYLTDSGEISLDYNKEWPSATLRGPESIHITYSCGYGDSAKVPQRIKQAILLLVGTWYENREGSTAGSWNEIPFGVRELLWPLREIVL